MDILLKGRQELSASFAESLGFPGAVVGIGQTAQTSRPDALRSWIATTAHGWAAILKTEFERVLERPVTLDLTPCLQRLVPVNQWLAIVGRLIQQGVDEDEAKRLAGLH